ncbi:hypothetical protein ACFQH9_28005 [Pseudonocardia lutea]|uniref:Uncharacterized protein n=1 Tax=Pseudonocardia lutea TaxID=2172015 RepID=A0ABW1IFP8_9PSEU
MVLLTLLLSTNRATRSSELSAGFVALVRVLAAVVLLCFLFWLALMRGMR